MLRVILHKMSKNKWIVFCQLLGLILTTAIMSSIPMYSSSIIQNVLTRDMSNLWKNENIYPGGYLISKGYYATPQLEMNSGSRKSNKNKISHDAGLEDPDEFAEQIKLPILNKKATIVSGEFKLRDSNNRMITNLPSLWVKGISNFKDHVNIVQGRMPSNKISGEGCYEVMVSKKAMEEMNLGLDVPYQLQYWNDELPSNATIYKANMVPIKVVGIYEPKDAAEAFWYDGDWVNRGSFIMDYSLFKSGYMNDDSIYNVISSVRWFYAFDYKKITTGNFEDLLNSVDSQKNDIKNKIGFENAFGGKEVLEQYRGREKEIKTVLWVVHTPILIMLILYMYMMSRLIIEQDRNEISVLKSRGADTGQIIQMYLIEGLLLGGVAVLFGPFLGMLLCRVIGFSDGFLQFVQRTPLKISLSLSAYGYSLIGVIIFMLTILVSSLGAARETIVIHKQKKARGNRRTLWKKYYLDILLLGITGYGLSNYNMRASISKITGVIGNGLPVDPILYLISTFFILGVGLSFLRLYPYIIKLIFLTGKNKWSPEAYVSLVNAERFEGKNQFVMLFLVLTISIGIFNLKAAGTINENLENNTRHSIGADMVLVPNYNSEADDEDTLLTDDFNKYKQLSGVQMATKVFYSTFSDVKMGSNERSGIFLMGITPDEFGRIAYMKNGLLAYHFNEYLNAIAKDPRAMMVSRSFAAKYKLKVGDTIYVRRSGGQYAEGYVSSFIDYWPSVNLTKDTTYLVVASIDYLSKYMLTMPYQVWIKKGEGSTSGEIYNDITSKKIQLKDIKDLSQSIIKSKRDPIVQGINGTLTLGFIMTMLITLIGFLIHWILNIKERTLQFGILRSMGITLGGLIKVLTLEQLLISGIAIVMGVVIGEFNGRTFVPLLKIASTESQLIPFRVAAGGGEYLTLFVILAAMLIFVFYILSQYVSRIKIDQAIKLGED